MRIKQIINTRNEMLIAFFTKETFTCFWHLLQKKQ